ncbi:zinc-binding dehydrogenase [Streptomyces sp. NPDC059837]|uniref:zinc-dependent alcohol dehydrogenase n=1 Tax=unclassified Streptomyces TaxID=2593676 RepID=UPI00224E018D|nr:MULTISPECIES: zinc-binding dehydrogenase [unclassified Streptomyces]MCX4404703.1 alcohol dehydrogenase catalytic domain-containing protein [Streptomyces sp. NBC_01764]MCX5190751.1 alcohol dehydrogenase catalytic domain-containing protein [Streptomyces sp. NBC_00268]
MATMKSVQTGAKNTIDVVETERPVPGPKDVLIRIRACGICGTDTFFVQSGGTPYNADGSVVSLLLGHEPAGEIAELGAEVTGLKVGDRVVVNPQGVPSGIIGCGGAHGGMSEYLLLEDAEIGRTLAVFPDTVPFDVAALNEPMAVARHCVNRSEAGPADKVVVFGAGPIGLGVTIWLKLRGVEHVVVADVIPERLQTALAVGADAVIDSATEDVTARLTELHGEAANALGQPRAGTDIYIDAAGVAAVFNTTVDAAKWGAKLVMVAVQKPSEAIDLGGMLRSELTLIASQGYPTEIFEVTAELAEHQERFAKLISHRVPFAEVARAFELALTPGAAEKVVVTYDDEA